MSSKELIGNYPNNYETVIQRLRSSRMAKLIEKEGLWKVSKPYLLATSVVLASIGVLNPSNSSYPENSNAPITEPQVKPVATPEEKLTPNVERENSSNKFNLLPTGQLIELTVRNDSEKYLGIVYRKEPSILSEKVLDANNNLVYLNPGEKIGFGNSVFIETRDDGSVGIWGKNDIGYFSFIDPTDNKPLVNLRHKESEESMDKPTVFKWADFCYELNEIYLITNKDKEPLDFSKIFNPQKSNK